MVESFQRPEAQQIKAAYDQLFHHYAGILKIKDAALGGRLFDIAQGGDGVPGRSIAWKLFLAPTEPLQPATDFSPSPYIDALRSSRRDFTDMLMNRMRAPDGSYEDGFVIPGTSSSPPKTDKSAGNLARNNPLSLDEQNPWTDWFASIELRKTILQDVERTFPDVAYFRDPDIQTQLTYILYLYSVMHPDIGYRQGMHELLAPIYFALDYDSVSTSDSSPSFEPAFLDMCDRVWISADAWTLFSSVMRGVSRWYEWREPSRVTATSASPLSTHVNLNVPNGRLEMQPYVAPIVRSCQQMQSEYLKNVDPQLWKSMQAAGIEPQIYGIRWLRLLFTREFPLDDAMVLWDGLFAVDPKFELACWVCVAMLLRIRNQLIPADYSGQLTYLLKYPARPPTDPEDPPSSHHATLLLRQALTLQMSPSPATGVSIVMENRNLLHIPMEVPDPPPPPSRRRPAPNHGERGKSIAAVEGTRSLGRAAGQAHGRTDSQQSVGLPEVTMLAKGLLDRGESLGINRTNIMNAVSELRRNLPDFAASAASFVRTPTTPGTSFSDLQMAVERSNNVPPEERPPWEPRTRFEMEREIAELKGVQRRLGRAMNWIVDAVLLDADPSEGERAKQVQERKREAIEALAYIRDVLNSGTTTIEEDRLVSEEELRARKAAREQRPSDGDASTSATHNPVPQPVAAPAPVASAAPPSTSAAPRTTSPRARQPPLPQEPRIPNARAFARSPSSSTTAFMPMPTPISSSASYASSQPTSPPPVSSPVMTPGSGSNSTAMHMAPWNYTKSSFGSAASSIVPPPPASASSRSPPTMPTLQPPPPARSEQSNERKQAGRTVDHDPLGALR